MATDYWTRALRGRVSRRRALAVTGSGALGAAFLAACGGDDDNGSSGTSGGGTGSNGTASSGLLTAPQDTTAEARRGGTLKFSVTADIPNLDPQILSFANAAQVLLNYNRLVRVKPGVLERADGTIDGDLAQSWEFSPDKLTLTMKLRPNAGMPDIPPVNGRNLDSSDVMFSWERWVANGSSRSDLVNSVNASAPILSLEAPDASTVVIKLKQPVSSIMSSLANQASGYFFTVPKEGDSQFELKTRALGGGSYYMSDYQPSSRFVYTRNPNHYDADKLLFPDVIEVPIISEYATGLAQLKSGGLHTYTVTSEDILQTKNDVPSLNLYQTDLASLPVSQFFGFQQGDGTPFRDVRLRQALSMSMDRDLYIDTFGNADRFEADGLPVERAWNTSVNSYGYSGWWLDPQGADFGPTAKYYQRNIEEAQKLAEAAGFSDRVPVIANQIAGAEYGPSYPRVVEALHGMASEGPFNLEIRTHNYATEWFSQFRDSRGYFDGVAYRLTPYPADPGEMLYAVYNKGGTLYYGFDKDGKGTPQGQPFTGDPTAEDLTERIRAEFDEGSRQAMAKELQRYLAEQQYFITELGAASSFQLASPVVKNWLVYTTAATGGDFGQFWGSLWLDA